MRQVFEEIICMDMNASFIEIGELRA